MQISEVEMLWGALAFELGVPLLALVALVRVSRLRKFVSVLLGAVTPIVVFYATVVVAYLLNPKANVFAFYAMWVMTFFAYVALLVIGIALAFVPKPSNLYARFVVGLAAAPLAYLLLKYVV